MSIPIAQLSSGNWIPLVGLGTWKLSGPFSVKTIGLALELGYRHIDTALMYENHTSIREAITYFPRKELFITTKLPREYLDPKQVEKQCDRSLKELGCDYLDLFLIHWPNRKALLSAVFYEMLRLKEKGKIQDAGVSNFTIHHLQDLLKDGLEVAVNQVEFHPHLYQKELLEFCKGKKILLTAYTPLARGMLRENITLIEIGSRYGKSANQVALRWLIDKGVVAIPKASSEAHLRENLDIFDFTLSEEERAKIDSIAPSYRLICPDIQEFDY